MNTISITSLYDQLCTKLGKETAVNLTTFIDNKINDVVERKTQNLATKEDILVLKEDIYVLKNDIHLLKQDFSLLREDFSKHTLSTKEDISMLREDFGRLRESIVGIDGKIDSKIDRSRTETIKWMFGFWVGQMIITFGLILLFLKK